MICHAGLVAMHNRRGWRGALIEGNSGRGKSDLALRTLERGLRLVADDQVVVFIAGGRLFGRCPAPLVDMLEMRGMGIARIGSLFVAEIVLAVSCIDPGEGERLPEPAKARVLGISIPLVHVSALEPSAPAKLCRALEVLGSSGQEDYYAAFPRNAPREST